MVLDSRTLDTGLFYRGLREHWGATRQHAYAGLRGFVAGRGLHDTEPASLSRSCQMVSRIVALGDLATRTAADRCPQRSLIALLDQRDRADHRPLADIHIALVQPARRLLDLVAAFQPQARRLITFVPDSMQSWYEEISAAVEERDWSVEALAVEDPVQAHRQLARALLARPYDAVILPPGGEVVTPDTLRTLYVIAARHHILLYGGLSADITRGGVFATVSVPEGKLLQAVETATSQDNATPQTTRVELHADQPVFNHNLFRLRFPGRPVPSVPALQPWPP